MTDVELRSQSDPNRTYHVIVQTPDETREAICECEGYKYRGECKHQEIAMTALCKWSQSDGPEQQNEDQKKNLICPRCGGPTEWRMEWE